MTNRKILELLEAERKCIWRNIDHECDRDCGKCDLVQDDLDLMELYTVLIQEYKRKVWNDDIEAREQEITYNRVNGCS